MFKDLKPINDNAKYPQFLIAGAEWSGYVWETSRGLDEINHKRSDGVVLCVRARDEKGIWLSIRKELAPGVYAEKGRNFDSVEAAAEAGVTASFQTVEGAGVTWFVCQDNGGFTEWRTAFGPHDSGIVSSHAIPGEPLYFQCERQIEVDGRVFKINHYGYSGSHRDGACTAINAFDEAAQACAGIFDLLLTARGGASFQNAFKAGREALKREIASL